MEKVPDLTRCKLLMELRKTTNTLSLQSSLAFESGFSKCELLPPPTSNPKHLQPIRRANGFIIQNPLFVAGTQGDSSYFSLYEDRMSRREVQLAINLRMD